MTAVLDSALAIPLDLSLEAHEPPEARGHGRTRGDVRLLVSHGDTDVTHTRFGQLPFHLHFDIARTSILESNPGPETTAYGLLADFINAVR